VVDQELPQLNCLPLKFNLVKHVFKRLRLERFFLWWVYLVALVFFFYFFMRFEELPDES
jgi:phosphoglycerol transferase MdoB-like AlkP superfamily enzyme